MLLGPVTIGVLYLCIISTVNAGAIIRDDYNCSDKEFLDDEQTCKACPECKPGFGYPDDQECGYGKGANTTCELCPEGKYRSSEEEVFSCKTCTNCVKYYNKEFEYKCRPELDAKCGKCLDGYEEVPSSFMEMPCQLCTPESTSEVCVKWFDKQRKNEFAALKLSEDERKQKEKMDRMTSQLRTMTSELRTAQDNLETEKRRGKKSKEMHAGEILAYQISVGVLGGILSIVMLVLTACCIKRRCKITSPGPMANVKVSSSDRDSSLISDPEALHQTELLIRNGSIVQYVRKEKEFAQGAVRTGAAEPQHSLEDDDLPSQNPSEQGETTQIYGTNDHSLNSVPPPEPFPNSGYYSMSSPSDRAPSTVGGSEASTALVQDGSSIGMRSRSADRVDGFSRRSYTSLGSDDAESQSGRSYLPSYATPHYDPPPNTQPVRNRERPDAVPGVIPRAFPGAAPGAALAAVHGAARRQSRPSQPPMNPAPPGAATRPTSIPPRDDPDATPLLRLGASVPVSVPSRHQGARPKERPAPKPQESEEQAADTRRYQEALRCCRGKKVVDLTHQQKALLGLKLSPENPPLDGMPHFRSVAEDLGIPRDVFKLWENGCKLVQWMCDQETYRKDLLRSLHEHKMVAARNYLVTVILSGVEFASNSDEQGACGGQEPTNIRDDGIAFDSTARDNRDGPSRNLGQSIERQSSQVELAVDDSGIPVPAEDQGLPLCLDNVEPDLSNPASPVTFEGGASVQESKGESPYGVQETNVAGS